MEIIFITFFQLFLLTVDRRQGDIQVKEEGVGRDRRQNKTQTASDFLWILNIEKQTAAGTKTGLRVKHPDIGTIVMSRGHKDGAGVRRSSG